MTDLFSASVRNMDEILSRLDRPPQTGNQIITLSDGRRVQCVVTYAGEGEYLATEMGYDRGRPTCMRNSAPEALAGLREALEQELDAEGCSRCISIGEACDACYEDSQHEGETSGQFAARAFGDER